MKRIFKSGWMLLLPAFLIAGCNDKPDLDLVGKFHSKPITEVVVNGSNVVELDYDQREINIIYDTPGDFSNLTVNLTLAEGVKMIAPATNPFTIDLSDGEDKEIVVWSYDRTITYRIRASVLIDVAEPITAFTASVGERQAVTAIDHAKRTISVKFDYNVDLTAVSVDYTLAEDVSVVSPEGKTWDMSAPVVMKLRKFGMEANYNVTVIIDVDVAEPFDAASFTAMAEGTYPAVVNVNHATRVIGLSFDGYQIDLSSVAVDYTLAPGVTAVSPASKTWTLDENTPSEFIVEKLGLQITYTVNTKVDIDVARPILTFTAAAGGDDAQTVINHSARTIYLIFDNPDADLTAVTVDYTFAENVSAVSPTGKTWDLSTASRTDPLEFKIHKLGMDLIYNVYPASFFVPSFRDKNGDETGVVPDGWERISEGISPEIALYKITKWIDDEENTINQIVAYAVAMSPRMTTIKTVGYGYDSPKSMPAMVADFPGYEIMVSGGDTRQLLKIDGSVIENINGEAAYSLMIDYDGECRQFGVTNRYNEHGVACDANGDRTDQPSGTPYFGNDLYWWDIPANKFTNVESSAFAGAGHLNWNAYNLQHLSSFPYGVFDGAGKTRDAQIAYGSGGGNVFFLVCEMSSRSGGLSAWNMMEILRNLGAYEGGISSANKNSIGLYVNGQSVLQKETYSSMGFAWAVKAK